MITREEKVERHFRNTVQEKLIDLMKVMDPGGQRNWSYNYKDLLAAAKERIEAELLHESNFAAESKPKVVTAEKMVACLDCGKPVPFVGSYVKAGKHPLCEGCFKDENATSNQVALALPKHPASS